MGVCNEFLKVSTPSFKSYTAYIRKVLANGFRSACIISLGSPQLFLGSNNGFLKWPQQVLEGGIRRRSQKRICGTGHKRLSTVSTVFLGNHSMPSSCSRSRFARVRGDSCSVSSGSDYCRFRERGFPLRVTGVLTTDFLECPGGIRAGRFLERSEKAQKPHDYPNWFSVVGRSKLADEWGIRASGFWD